MRHDGPSGAAARQSGGAGGVALAAALLAVSPAGAQDGEPIVLSPRPELKWIDILEWEAAVELEWRRNVDEVEPEGGTRTRDVEDRLSEIFEISALGYVGHPNLLQLDVGTRLRLRQRWLDLESDTRNERINETVLDWDVSGLMFQQSLAPITVYSRQNTSDIDRQFGGTLENTFSETGVRATVRSETFPTNIQLFYREIDQVDPGIDLDFNIRQYTAQGDGRIEMGQTQRLAWDVQYDDVDEAGQGRTTRSFERFEGNATHTVEFGADQQNSLRSRARLFDESGDRDFLQLSLNERLRFRHSDSLSSWYDYTFDRFRRPDQEQVRHEGRANVQHQLFESLTTLGTAGVNYLEIPTEDFDSTELFLFLDPEYTKQVPYGTLFLGGDMLVSTLDQSPRGAPVQVVDDLNVFNAANLIVIDRRNIVASSIVVTDVTGLIVFTEGADYTVLALSDRVEIRRIPGGSIAPGEAVLVDYVIGPDPGGTTDTFGLGADIRYTFDEGPLAGLSLYGRYFDQDESRSILSLDFPENDFTDLIYGAEYNLWKLYFKVEKQIRDSTLSSFDSLRFEGRYVERFGRNNALVLSALHQDLDRTDDFITTTTTTFSGQWSQQVTEQLRLSLILQYQLIDDSISGDTEAFEQQLDLNWRYGQTEVFAQVRNSYRDTESDDTLFQRFVVGIRREF